MLPLLIFFNVLSCLHVSANEGKGLSSIDFVDAIRQAEELNQEAKKLIHKNLLDILKEPHSKKGCPSQLVNGEEKDTTKGYLKGCVKNSMPHFPSTENADQVMVFVSFSMPEASLKSLFQETPLHNAVLIMRGLYEESFVRTAVKLQELGVTIDINPELFDTHHVTSVPTFLLVRNSQAVLSLKGNVTLAFASQKFKDQLIVNQDTSSKSEEALCS